MALNRPPKSRRDDGPFEDPNDVTYDLGMLQVTLHKENDRWDESAITMKIKGRDTLLEPNFADHSKQPSEADKVVYLTKRIMQSTGMTLIDGPGGNGPSNPGGSENRLKLAMMEFTSYKPGSSGITIRATQGMYGEGFNGDAMMHEAGVALERIAMLVKDAPTPTKFRERLDPAFDDADFYNKPLDYALKPQHEKDAEQQLAEQQAEEARLKRSEEKLKQVIGKYVPKADMTPEARGDVIEKIAKGVLCAGEACWTKGDKLEGNIREALQQAKSDKQISEGALDFIVSEMASEIQKHTRGTARA